MEKIHKINERLTAKYTGKPVAEVITKLKMKNIVVGSCVAFGSYMKDTKLNLKICYSVFVTLDTTKDVELQYLATKILDVKYKKETVLE